MSQCHSCFATVREISLKPTESLPWAFLLAVLTFTTGRAVAQEEPAAPARFRESVTLETSRQASRQFAIAIEHAQAARWDEAAEELARVTSTEPDALVGIAPGQYLNVRRYANLLATTFPSAGLSEFRKRIDRAAMDRFEKARDAFDETGLRRIIRDSFASSAGADALLLLGDRAFERGDFSSARGIYRQLLPSSQPQTPGDAPPVFRYPDSPLGRAPILARLVLCSLLEGDRPRAALELAAFAKLHPTETGTLAGRSGVLVEILRELSKKSANWKDARPDNRATADMLVDIGAPLWSRPIADDPYRPRDSVPFFDQRMLSTFPIVHRNLVLYNDADRVFAYDLETGKPAWPSGEMDSAEIYPAVAGQRPPLPDEAMVGVPRYTMTISEGRLYARMGSPVTGRSAQELRNQDDHLVCLDLDQGEGKLIWRTEPDAKQANAAFEGSPVISDGRLFVAMRQGFPETQTNVACRDAASGRLLWSRRVGAAVSDLSESQNLISHHVFTLGDDAVFYSTDMGAVAALEKSDGVIRWVTTYETSADRAARMLDDPASSGLTPCLYHAGSVFAAPNDSEEIFSLDSSTGAPIWQRALPGGVRYMLGLRSGCLVVSGRMLWGLDPETGAVRWQIGYSDPTSGSFGQGQLAGDDVFWPTRDEIFIVAQTNGEIRRRIPLSALHGMQGGNLTISNGHLVIAGADRLTVFGASSSLGNDANPLFSAAGR